MIRTAMAHVDNKMYRMSLQLMISTFIFSIIIHRWDICLTKRILYNIPHIYRNKNQSFIALPSYFKDRDNFVWHEESHVTPCLMDGHCILNGFDMGYSLPFGAARERRYVVTAEKSAKLRMNSNEWAESTDDYFKDW